MAANTIATLMIDLGANVARLQKDMQAANGVVSREIRQMRRTVQSLKATFEGVFIGSGVLLFGRQLVRAGIEGESSQNRLTAALRATGHQIGIARSELDDMAESMAVTTQFDDEGLRNAQSQLAKFGNIHGQVFRDAMGLSADLAAFMDTDVSSAAQQLGKALQSPTEGVSLLERHIGKLTEAQEKNIKSLAAQGRGVEAQNAVLAVLRERIGGTAQVMNTGLKASTSGVAKAWDDMLEAWARSESVGGTVKGVLGGIRDILRDIEGLTKTEDPLVRHQRGLATINATIEKLEGHIREGRNQQRAFGGAGEDDPVLVARLNQLKALRAAQLAVVNGMARAGSAENMDARDLQLLGPKPITLGGTTTDKSGDAAAQRDAEFRAEKAVELQELALQDQREAQDAYTKYFQGVLEDRQHIVRQFETENGDIAISVTERVVQNEGRAFEIRQQMHKEWFANIDADQERAIEQGAEYLDGVRALAEESERFGDAINSAFDRAVRGGEDAVDIVKNLVKELAMIELQKRVFQPASKAFSAGLDRLFSGGSAAESSGGEPGPAAFAASSESFNAAYESIDYIGAFASGSDYVPRDGLAFVHQGERITPADENWGGGNTVTVNQNIHVDSRADVASVQEAMVTAKNQALAAIENSLNRGSRRFTPR